MKKSKYSSKMKNGGKTSKYSSKMKGMMKGKTVPTFNEVVKKKTGGKL